MHVFRGFKTGLAGVDLPAVSFEAEVPDLACGSTGTSASLGQVLHESSRFAVPCHDFAIKRNQAIAVIKVMVVLVAVDGAPPLLSPSRGAMPRGSCDGPAQASRAYSGEVNSVVRSGPPRACACARGGSVRGDVGGRSLCLVHLPHAWAHANRQRHARAPHAEAARLAAAHAAPRMHARARKAHATSGRTRGRCLGDGAGCRTRSGDGARARRHGGVCRGMGPWAARAGRLSAPGFWVPLLPRASALARVFIHAAPSSVSPGIAQDNGRTRRLRPAPGGSLLQASADRFLRETRQSTANCPTAQRPTGIHWPSAVHRAVPATHAALPMRPGHGRPFPWRAISGGAAVPGLPPPPSPPPGALHRAFFAPAAGRLLLRPPAVRGHCAAATPCRRIRRSWVPPPPGCARRNPSRAVCHGLSGHPRQ